MSELDNPKCDWGDIVQQGDAMKWDWPNFSVKEMTCRCGCKKCNMSGEFMDKLQLLRLDLDFPMPVSSGYRCEEWDKACRGKGVHTLGIAADIRVHGSKALKLISRAEQLGFTGVGVSQIGRYENRFIHLDLLPSSAKHPRPWLWGY